MTQTITNESPANTAKPTLRTTLSKKWRRIKGKATVCCTNCFSPFVNNPVLRGYKASQVDADGSIKRALENYTNSVSTPVAAVSQEMANVIWFTLQKKQPKIAVDLGSGFSSYLLRRYQAERVAEGAECTIMSCDDDAHWLERTREYIEQHGLPSEGLYTWDDFLREQPDIKPDLILHDLGHTVERVENMPRVMEMAHPGTIILLDDVQKRPIREAAMREAANHSYPYYDLTGFTFDNYGRYAAMAIGT